MKDAKKEVEAHLGAANRGDVDVTTRQQTLQVLASKVQDATAARKAFAETVPGEPAFFAAALDAVRGHITEEEELELTSDQREIVLQAVRLEVNRQMGKAVGTVKLPSLPRSAHQTTLGAESLRSSN